MKTALRNAIISILVVATIAVAFILLDDTHDQTILSGIKTFIPAIRFRATGGGTNYIGLIGPATVPTSVTFKLPTGDGTNGQVVVTDGSANLAFANIPTPVPTLVPFSIPHYAFTALPTPIAGSIVYCDDCSPLSPCAADTPSADGTFAFAEGADWNCCLGCTCSTATPTVTPTSTNTPTATATATATATNTPTATPT